MNKIKELLSAFLLFLCITTQAQVSTGGSGTTANHNKQIIGYVTQWDAWKSSSAGLPSAGSLTQLNIDYSKYTILNYSFFGVANDGSLHSGDFRNKNIYMDGQVQEPADIFCTDIYSSWDLYILFGQLDIVQYISSDVATRAAEQGFDVEVGGTTWSNPTWGLYNKDLPLPLKTENGAGGLLDLAHENGVKVMASIGGWSMCKHFPEMAADATKRARFIEDCKTLMNIGFDGIDIDWEYPGYGGMNFDGSNDDFANYTILLQDIRDAIGSDKLITVAMSAAPSKLEGFEWSKLVNIVNYFNMMTYDFNGGWSNIAGHNAPLYEYDGAEEPDFNWQATLEKLTEKGVSPAQVNMGSPFYGRGVVCNGTADLNVATVKTSVTIQPDGPVSTCADYTNWPLDVYDGTPNYSYIVQKTGLGTSNGWTRHWDAQAKVPYMTNGKYFLSYDDEESIGLKAQFIVDNNLAGSIIWTAYGDLEIGGTATNYGTKLVKYSDVSSDLVNTINDVFANGSTDTGDDDSTSAPTVKITAPADGASLSTDTAITITATATDSDGNILQVEFFQNGSSIGVDTTSPYAITLDSLQTGSYTFKAIATDNDNLSTTSATINITVSSNSDDNDGNEDGGSDDETGTDCWNDWVAGAYVGGSQVSYNGVNYQAKWWTNGVPGEDDGWEDMGTCGGSQSGDDSDDDSTSDCWNDWVEGAYVGGSQVSYNGVNYQAKWWTNGVPGEDDVWENMGSCGGSTSDLTVSAGESYTAGINEEIKFIGTVSGGQGTYTYYWDFDDESTSNAQNPTHSYANAGTYNVTFEVSDSADSAISEVTVTITDNTVIPTAPSELTATATSSSAIKLSWADNSDNESTFHIQISNDNLIWSDLDSISAGTSNYTSTGLSSSSTYYYRVCSANTAGKSDYSNVASATTLTEGSTSTDLPSTIMSGYWHSWNAGVPFMELNQVDSHWDVINIAFAEPQAAGSTNGAMKFEVSGLTSSYTDDDFKQDIKDLQAQGKKIVLSIGGYEGYFSLTSESAVNTFVSDIKSFIDEYGFDGIDIDLEQYSIEFESGSDPDFTNPTSPKVVYLIEALEQIVNSYDSDFILSFAPETFYFQMAYTYYGGLNSYVDTRSGVYIPVIYALRDHTTYVQAQLYNSASIKGLDDNWYDMGTVEGIVEMCQMAIEGFPLNGNANYVFPGLRPDQVVIGVPSSTSAAGSGQISNANLQTAFNTVNEAYPGLRGIMTWSINWDDYQNDNSFAKENGEFLDELSTTKSAKSYPEDFIPSTESTLLVYPNPVKETLHIAGINENAQIDIYNSEGVKVSTFSSSSINVSFLNPGVYILRIVDKNKTYRQLFIKE